MNLNSAPKVSILTPFKNTEKYISECLDSILDQGFSNWELIIIDDHSTDKSKEIVHSYSNKEKRIKLFTNIGKGIIPALQLAYSKATGDLITRMDSDDIMTPNKLEWMVNALKKNGKGYLAVGQVNYFSSKGISDGYDRYEKWLNTLTLEGRNYEEIYKECVIPSPCWMAYREDFEKCDAFYPNRYPEDYDLTFRFYEYDLKVIPCNEILHLWRDYPTRTSRTHEHYAQNYFLDIKLHYFLKLNFDKDRPLSIWGAGFKGKYLAKSLVEREIDFNWICDNPKKIGRKIYGVELMPFEKLKELDDPQSIISVANELAQEEIRSYLHSNGMKNMIDYFFFC